MIKKCVIYCFFALSIGLGGKYIWIRLLDIDMLHLLYTIASEHNEPEISPLTSINDFGLRIEEYQKNTQNSNLIKLLKEPKSLVFFSNPSEYILKKLDSYNLEILIEQKILLPRWEMHAYKICFNGIYGVKNIIGKFNTCYPVTLSGDIIKIDKKDFVVKF